MSRQRKLPDGMWKRGKVYYARFRVNGRVVRKRLSTDFRAASEMLNELRSRSDKADFDLLDNDFSIEEIKNHWLRHCDQTLRPGTVKRYRQNLHNILSEIPCRRVSQITTPVVMTYRRERLLHVLVEKEDYVKTVAPRTVNQEVGAISTMLNWAVKHRLIGSNPLAGLKPLPEDEKRKERRALSPEEVQAIFDESPNYMLPVLRMFATSGIRHEELVKMKFSDVDFKRKMVVVRASTAKNKQSREIPLDDEMLAIIAELQNEAPQRQASKTTPEAKLSYAHVFVSQANTPLRNNLLRKFYVICKRAGIEGAHRNGSVNIHSLRGTFTTISIDNGASPKAVQSILGHKTLEMTMNAYAKATEVAKRDAVSALPFAKSTTPKHIVSMQNAHNTRTAKNDQTQTKAS